MSIEERKERAKTASVRVCWYMLCHTVMHERRRLCRLTDRVARKLKAQRLVRASMAVGSSNDAIVLSTSRSVLPYPQFPLSAKAYRGTIAHAFPCTDHSRLCGVLGSLIWKAVAGMWVLWSASSTCVSTHMSPYYVKLHRLHCLHSPEGCIHLAGNGIGCKAQGRSSAGPHLDHDRLWCREATGVLIKHDGV